MSAKRKTPSCSLDRTYTRRHTCALTTKIAFRKMSMSAGWRPRHSSKLLHLRCVAASSNRGWFAGKAKRSDQYCNAAMTKDALGLMRFMAGEKVLQGFAISAKLHFMKWLHRKRRGSTTSARITTRTLHSGSPRFASTFFL